MIAPDIAAPVAETPAPLAVLGTIVPSIASVWPSVVLCALAEIDEPLTFSVKVVLRLNTPEVTWLVIEGRADAILDLVKLVHAYPGCLSRAPVAQRVAVFAFAGRT